MFAGSHVVIAEDLTLNAKIIECSVKTLDCKTTKVKNGAELVKLYIEKNHLIDYIITDVLMPELDGIEAVRQIREFEMLHSLMKIPIIALTGNSTAKMKQSAFQAGVSEFLIKPISIKQVAKTFLEAAPKTGTILLVDDDTLCLEINKQMLSTGGYSIRQAQCPKDVLEQLLAGQITVQLIVIDYMMPFINGIEFTQALRKWEVANGAERQIPIILCSGIEDVDFKSMCLQYEVNEVLVKPISRKVL
jgi:CheY-like chemotaxis protein